MGKPCRCLLFEAGEKELAENISRYLENMSAEIKAPNELYKKRLKICESCTHLVNGMCGKCGCYVELRAAVEKSRCPSEERFW